MAKAGKKIQTDYTKGGHEISQTAIPLYKSNLERMDQYLYDPTQYIDMYRDKYYTDTTEQSDFMRDYQRAMAQRTGANYAATSGGYSSEGQRAYDDLQRYASDQANRLYTQGLSNSAAMAQQYYNNLLSASPVYHDAYGLGKEYSDIEQYNNAAEQNNKFGNQLAGSLGTIGTAIGSIWGPAGAAIGNALGSAIGGMTSTDYSSILGSVGGSVDNKMNAMDFGSLGAGSEGIANALKGLFNRSNTTTTGQQSSSSSGGWGLNTTQPTSGYKFSWQQ